ncbi:MAG: DNA-binding protein [Alphaproteobacteria bacterium]|nr:DNA-binding protein [Alphaproteobacteria bacterium]
MSIKPIKTETDYEEALARIEGLFSAKPNTDEGDQLDILITLVSAYEDIHYKIDTPDPIEAIKHIMEAKGLKNKDLVDSMGTKSRVSEVMNKKRRLSLSMIRNLHQSLKIPAKILVNEYELSGKVHG